MRRIRSQVGVEDTIASSGVGQSFWFNGRAVGYRPGDTIGAALTRAGYVELRRTGSGAPRGLFCGIGICYDCLIWVEGQPNVRACITEPRPGQKVSSAGLESP